MVVLCESVLHVYCMCVACVCVLYLTCVLHALCCLSAFVEDSPFRVVAPGKAQGVQP